MRISDWSSDVCSSDLVIRTVRPKYSCRACDKIVQAPAPAKAIARGKASFATLAHVVVHKFDHHLPLYRQAEMMAAQGIDIDRSTLAGWAGQAAHLDRKSTRLNFQSLMRISYAVFCLKKKHTQ